jgi:hypothetical protein
MTTIYKKFSLLIALSAFFAHYCAAELPTHIIESAENIADDTSYEKLYSYALQLMNINDSEHIQELENILLKPMGYSSMVFSHLVNNYGKYLGASVLSVPLAGIMWPVILDLSNAPSTGVADRIDYAYGVYDEWRKTACFYKRAFFDVGNVLFPSAIIAGSVGFLLSYFDTNAKRDEHTANILSLIKKEIEPAARLVQQLQQLLQNNRLDEAYELAQNNKAELAQLSDEERMKLLLEINKAHGALAQAHESAAEAWPFIRQYLQRKLGSEADRVKRLSDLVRMINN